MLLFAVILMFVVRPLLAMLGTNMEQAQAEASVAKLPGRTAAGAATLASAPDRAQIIDMAKKNPDATAVVVKEWLKSPT